MKSRSKVFFQISTVFVYCFMLFLLGTEEINATELNFNKSKTVHIKDQEVYPFAKKFIWVKYKAPANGYITVKAEASSSEVASGEWTLYNEGKLSTLSEKNIVYNTKESAGINWRMSTFGVKKNSTYYLRVRAYNPVKITYSFKKVNEKSGQTRSKAVNLKRQKAISGITMADIGDTPDWYKIKLTKNSKLYFYMKIRAVGKIRLSLYSDTGRGLIYHDFEYASKEQKITIGQKNNKTGKTSGIAAGTYYIKIDGVDSKSSGYYTLKWK